MYALFILGISAFIFSLILTPLCRDLFLKAGLVDMPDSDRKLHLLPVPRVGGIAVALSYACALGLVFVVNPGGSRLYVQHHVLFTALLPAATIIFITGLLDDLLGLKPWQKLLGQLLAASTAVALGTRLSMMPTHPSIAIALSIMWLIGCSNAVNLIDGMDGLATGVGLLATLTTLFFALLSGNTGLALATIPLAGALLAFLRYNFTPASVFLGDCGSLTIGFVLGCFGLIWSQHGGTMLGMLPPLMALSLPLIDVGLAIGRRFLRAVPIFKGDRGHIHHRVQALGLSTRDATLLLYAVCSVFASLAILESFSDKSLIIFIVVIFVILVLLGIRRLRYVEFSAARKSLSHTLLRSVVKEQIYLDELQRELLDADSAEDWWEIVRSVSVALSFASAHLELDSQVFSARFDNSLSSPDWHIHLALGDRGLLVLTRMGQKAPPRHTMAVLHKVQRTFCENMPVVHTSRSASAKSVVASAA